MAQRLIPVLAIILLLTGLRSAGAQPVQPPLSATAQAVTQYLLTDAELPSDFRRSSPFIEVSNERVVGAPGGADLAPVVIEARRLTEVGYTARGATPLPQLSTWVGVFADADGAWQYASNYAFPYYLPPATKTLPGPDVGEHSVVYRYTTGTGATATDNIFLFFQRDRLEIETIIRGTVGTVSVDDLLPVARAIDAKIVASPPEPPTEADLALFERPTPTVLVRGAVQLFREYFVDELDPAQLYREGWEGATRALQRAGVANLPPVPDYPSDAGEATALHMRTFPLLEMLAGDRLTQPQLAYAAINGMVAARNDCHTGHLTPQQFQQRKAAATGQEQVVIGFGSAKEGPDAPWRIVSVAPNSPAQRAGLRRGQEILEVNGRPVVGLTIAQAGELIRRGEGELNTFVIRNPSGTVVTIMVAPGRVAEPPLETRVLPGDIGYLRIYRFQAGPRQVELMRQAIEEFEGQSVRGWVLDLRGNPGGSGGTLLDLMSLFVQSGPLFGDITRGQPLQMATATGNALPVQRPLVILTNRGSASAADIMPGALQARGRAVIVGERTAGCMGRVAPGTGLLDHSVLGVTNSESVVGPDAVRLHRIGVSPNVEVLSPTPEEEERGVDRQLEAAMSVLGELIGAPAQPVPGPAPKAKELAIVTH